MKKLKLTTVILLMAAMAYGQGVAINEDGAAPHPSAMLDVTSTEKGILIPRMTQAERDAIAEPATGLLIFQTDAPAGFYFNAGSSAAPDWQRLGEGGAGQWSQSDDNIFYMGGNVGIGESSPDALLHINGTGQGQGNVLFAGDITLPPGDPPIEGPGARMMWYPDIASFRVGQVDGTHWDKTNLGFMSFAAGWNTIASGMHSVSIGTGTKAEALGSIALGSFADASYDYSTAFGYGTKAHSAYETVIGKHNSDYTPTNSWGWNPADHLFAIGNGLSNAERSNALTVLKNGNIGIGLIDPTQKLDIDGQIRIRGGDPGEGKVLTSDSDGTATWMTPFPGSNMQTLRHDGSGWVASGLLRNNGAGLGVNANPAAGSQLYLFRPFNSFGAGHSNIYAHRTGGNSPANGGISWSFAGVDAAIKGYSDYGNNFSAAVAGYGYLDYANSAAVIGSSYGGSTYGALAFKDETNSLYAGYFKGDVSVTGKVQILEGNMGIGTSSPDANAVLELSATDKGFLPPRMTLAQRDAISEPADGLIISCTDCQVPGLHQFINGTWIALAQRSFDTGDYGTVVNPVTGKVWLDRNLGASQVATSSTDPASYGDLYQWGRAADGHEKRNSPITTTIATTWFSGGNDWDGSFIAHNNYPYNWLDGNVTHLWTGTAAENNPCPSGFRVPTNAEWNQERLTWSSNDAAGAFASPLKLPLGGLRYDNSGAILFVGTNGCYWSSTSVSSPYIYGRTFIFGHDDAYMAQSYRATGRSVRCIKD